MPGTRDPSTYRGIATLWHGVRRASDARPLFCAGTCASAITCNIANFTRCGQPRGSGIPRGFWCFAVPPPDHAASHHNILKRRALPLISHGTRIGGLVHFWLHSCRGACPAAAVTSRNSIACSVGVATVTVSRNTPSATLRTQAQEETADFESP